MKSRKAKEIVRKRIEILEARLRNADETVSFYQEIKEEKEALELVLELSKL